MSVFPIRQVTARVTGNDSVGEATFRLTLSAPEFPPAARPGQFVMVRTSATADPMLRRAFSLHDCRDGSLEILYKVVGRGTAWMAQRHIGDALDLIGPLGQGFTAPPSLRKALLVAGGMGIAPFRFLIRSLRNAGTEMLLFYGARTERAFLELPEMKATGVSLLLATEDGSRGETGRVTELFREHFRKVEPSEQFKIFACGPREMLYEVARIARAQAIACDISLESHMACGLGTCMGCVIATENGYQRVCREGPVFPAESLLLNETSVAGELRSDTDLKGNAS